MKELIENQYLQLILIIITLCPVVALFFKLAINGYKSYINRSVMKIQSNYYKELDSEQYILWRDAQLKKIYGEEYFTNVFGITYPTFVIYFADNYKEYDFTQLYSKEDISTEGYKIEDGEIVFPPFEKTEIMTSGTQKEIVLKRNLLKQYKKILTGSIKYPKLAGFSLDHYDIENDRITHIYPKLGTYEYNVYSSHILEFELFKAYKHLSGAFDIHVESLWEHLPFRHYIHYGEGTDNQVKDVLFTGIRRFSLFSVQCIVVFMDYNTKEFKTLLMKRSTDPSRVSSKLGYYQLLPAGGFELYEKELIHSVEMIKENYSLRKAIFREYLEEVFNDEDFKGINSSTNSQTTDKILNHEKVIKILDLIEKKKAGFELLGVGVDLVSLRHEISFVLKIDDVSFSREDFCPNDEFTREKSLAPKVRASLNEVERLLNGGDKKLGAPPKFDQASAILYYMFYNSPLYP